MAGNDGQVVYNFNTIGGAVASIDTAISSMKTTLSELERDLRPLETGAWASQAQEAYQARKRRWNQAAEHIAITLGQVKVALQNASDRMQETDRKAVGYFPS
jgi:WXG100 family type VII secretion target